MGRIKADWLSTGHDSISLDPKWAPAGRRRALISCWGWYWGWGSFLGDEDHLQKIISWPIVIVCWVVSLQCWCDYWSLCLSFRSVYPFVWRDFPWLGISCFPTNIPHNDSFAWRSIMHLYSYQHAWYVFSVTFIHSFRCFTISCIWSAKISRLDVFFAHEV